MTRHALAPIILLLLAGCEKPANTPNSSAPASQPAPTQTPPPSQPAAPAADQPASGAMPYGLPEPKPKSPGSVRLVTYNVENLFDDHDDPALTGSVEDKDETKPAEHRAAAARAIKALNADVVALQEVESQRALSWWLAEQGLDKEFPFVVSLDAGDGRGIEQSVISRFPLSSPTQWIKMPLEGEHPKDLGTRPNPDFGKPLTLHRSPLAVDVTIPKGDGRPDDYTLTLFVLHNKAGRDSAYWREFEAHKHTQLIASLEKDRPGRNIAVLGDFNARPDEASFMIYLDESSPARLHDVFQGIRRNDPLYQTHVSNRIIDHILVNTALRHEIITDSRFVLGMPLPPRNAPFDGPKPPGYASDHLPVVVDLIPKDVDPAAGR